MTLDICMPSGHRLKRIFAHVIHLRLHMDQSAKIQGYCLTGILKYVIRAKATFQDNIVGFYFLFCFVVRLVSMWCEFYVSTSGNSHVFFFQIFLPFSPNLVPNHTPISSNTPPPCYLDPPHTPRPWRPQLGSSDPESDMPSPSRILSSV